MKNKHKGHKTMSETEKTNAKEVKVEAGKEQEKKTNAGGKEAQEVAEEATEQIGEEISREQELEKRWQACEAKAAEAADKYVRMAAEFDNFRRRTAKERLELISTASEDVIKGLLPVLDDCERALQVLRESKDTVAAIEGTELIYNKLMAFLKGKGLSVIEAKEKELDTEFHEAVAQFPVEEKTKKNKIIDIVQQGYLLNGKVIRYAKVVVGV